MDWDDVRKSRTENTGETFWTYDLQLVIPAKAGIQKFVGPLCRVYFREVIGQFADVLNLILYRGKNTHINRLKAAINLPL
jgi:hypothetical protein